MEKSKCGHCLSLANRSPQIRGMCLGFVACLMLSPSVLFAISDVPFILDGERVDARIVGPARVVKGKNSTRYSYPIEYSHANGHHRSGGALSRDASLKPGDTIPVRYLRSDPARWRTEDHLQSSWPVRVVAIITICILAASVLAGLKGIRDILRQVR